MNYSVVIPARYASTRLPGKALADIGGKPMAQRVYERATQCSASHVWVATDDQRIADALDQFGTKVLMTSTQHQSGTDRLAEVAEQLNMADDEIIVNVQGDEPMIPPEVIEQVAANLHAHPEAACATLSEPIDSEGDFFDPSVVKVVSDSNGLALYFSRASIPWPRDQLQDNTPNTLKTESTPLAAQRHIGIYAYRVGLLKQFTQWPIAPLEALESLEQLRILYQGERIHLAQACAAVPPGVDTPEDLEKVQQMWTANV